MKQTPILAPADDAFPQTSSTISSRCRVMTHLASRFLLLSVSMLLSAGFLATNSFAQSDNSQISGFVKDPSGAVVAGAQVVVRSQSKGLERTALTNAQGYYIVSQLPSDVYLLTVEHPGFKRTTITKKVDPSIGTNVDISLQIGAVSETVTVEATAANVQTETATLGKLVDGKEIQLTELNGRNPLFLALTKPGVVGGLLNGNNFGLTAGNFNINGSRGQSNTIFFDGAIGVRTRSNATFSIGTADLDATQEVQILTSNYNAEYGRSAGGQIRIVTKSGTKDFHGTFYEYLRNPVLNANTWTRNANPQPGSCDQQPVPTQCRPNQFRYNQFGYILGGPVILPGVHYNQHRDKLFWSFSQEWVKLRQEQLAQLRVPTLKMRQGDFSELTGPNQFFGSAIFLKDPTKSGACNPPVDQTGCFNDQGIINKIPANRLSPQGMALLNAYPLPIPGFVGTNGINWQASRPNPTDQLKSTLAIDFNPVPSHAVRWRGQLFGNKSFTPFPFGNEPGYAPRIFNLPNRWMSVNYVWTLSPTWINEALVTASKDRVETSVDTTTDAFKRSTYGISYPYFFSDPKAIPDKIPTVDFPTVWASLNGGPYPSSSSGPIYQFADNVTHIVGSHTIKFGGLFERSGENDFDQINVSGTPGGTNNQNGRFVFSNTTPGGTLNAIGNTAIGLFDTYAEIGNRSYTPYRSHMYEFFGQDSWKVTEKLRLELGARYSIIIPHWSLWRNMVVFDPRFYDPTHVATVDPGTGLITSGDLAAQYNGLVIPGDGWPDAAKQGCRVAIACTGQFDFLFRGTPKQYSDIHYNDIQPRVGFAYALGTKSVVRAGAGRFVDHWGVSDSVFLGGNPPLQPMVSITAGSVDNPGGKSGNLFPLQITSQGKNFANPESWQWNGTFEREIGADIVVTASYVGRKGLHLQREANINQLPAGTLLANPGVKPDALRPFKGFQIIRVTDNVASSFYNGLELEAHRRFTKGLFFGAAYTLSKSSDNGSAQRDIIPNALDPNVNQTLWGPSTFDRRHVLVVNVVYELPFFRNHSTWAGKILGGWTINEVSQFRTGTPFSITSGDDFAKVGPGSGAQFWVVNGPVPTLGQFTQPGSTTPASWIPLNKPGHTDCAKQHGSFAPFTDPAACYFTQPALGTFSQQQVRDIFYNAHDQNHNLALFKEFGIGERQKIQFRAEAFNWLNHPNLDSVASTNPTSTTFGQINNKTSERQLQFALRYSF
jgi:hypothetical protein